MNAADFTMDQAIRRFLGSIKEAGRVGVGLPRTLAGQEFEIEMSARAVKCFVERIEGYGRKRIYWRYAFTAFAKTARWVGPSSGPSHHMLLLMWLNNAAIELDQLIVAEKRNIIRTALNYCSQKIRVAKAVGFPVYEENSDEIETVLLDMEALCRKLNAA